MTHIATLISCVHYTQDLSQDGFFFPDDDEYLGCGTRLVPSISMNILQNHEFGQVHLPMCTCGIQRFCAKAVIRTPNAKASERLTTLVGLRRLVNMDLEIHKLKKTSYFMCFTQFFWVSLTYFNPFNLSYYFGFSSTNFLDLPWLQSLSLS